MSHLRVKSIAPRATGHAPAEGHSDWRLARCLPLSALALTILLCLALPLSVQADAPMPEPTGPERCALCHQQEVETWQSSPHANALNAAEDALQLACGEDLPQLDCSCLTCHTTDFDPVDRSYAHGGVTCEACHGPYVEDHPENGTMQLAVDSGICSGCHMDTYSHWADTEHAEAGVQCIGCHRAHTQELRLAEQTLCVSCHRSRLQDGGHVRHEQANIACVDCHTSPAVTTLNVNNDISGARSPSHDFTVADEVCSSCHESGFHSEDMIALASVLPEDSLAAARTTAAEPAQSSNTADSEESSAISAEGLAAITLGLGIGIGGFMGVVAVVAVSFVSQGRAKR